MAVPWAVDILVSTTLTPTALAVISFNKTTDREFNAVGGKEKKKKKKLQCIASRWENEAQTEKAGKPP